MTPRAPTVAEHVVARQHRHTRPALLDDHRRALRVAVASADPDDSTRPTRDRASGRDVRPGARCARRSATAPLGHRGGADQPVLRRFGSTAPPAARVRATRAPPYWRRSPVPATIGTRRRAALTTWRYVDVFATWAAPVANRHQPISGGALLPQLTLVIHRPFLNGVTRAVSAPSIATVRPDMGRMLVTS